jgi:hypothetical protein
MPSGFFVLHMKAHIKQKQADKEKRPMAPGGGGSVADQSAITRVCR